MDCWERYVIFFSFSFQYAIYFFFLNSFHSPITPFLGFLLYNKHNFLSTGMKIRKIEEMLRTKYFIKLHIELFWKSLKYIIIRLNNTLQFIFSI